MEEKEKFFSTFFRGHVEIEMKFSQTINNDDLVKSHQNDGFVKSSRCQARKNRGVKRTYKVRCNDEVEAERSRWTFYETINNQ